MAWTAKLLSISKAHGRFAVAISYRNADDGERIDKTYQFERTNKKAIRELARREVARLEEIKTQVIDITAGADIDLTPPPAPPGPPAPTPEQLAERLWFRDWNRLRVLLLLANAEIIQPTDPRIDPLKVSLRAGLLNSYLSDI